ncbi:O-antigen ligase family protein [Novipirellula maiorica]|nr:O-antigen ligase family protein [Rhodopirellula maiorica]
MASRQSSWLIDYLFFVVALNRGVRRVVDYNNGYFNPFSTISLTPIIVGGLAVVVVLLELNRRGHELGHRTANVLYLYGGAVAFAFVIGFINAKLGAVYALGDYIAPIGLMGYGSLWAADSKTIDRWCHTFAASVLVVAVYGIWQFYTIPPWDGFWLMASGMDGYMGIPEPTKMTLFSTMNERGPAAMYLCCGAILLMLRPGTLGLLRWPAAVAILFAMLLTYSRTTVIFAGLAVALFPLLNRGSGLLPVAGLSLLVLVAGPSIMARMPGQASARVETIGAIQDDGSFKGRIMLLGVALRGAIAEPLGRGIGADGMASRVQQASNAVVADSTGYVKTLATYGWIGFFVIVTVLYRLWRSSSDLVTWELDDRNVRIFRAWFIAGMVALFSGNWLVGASFFWVLAGYCLGKMDQEDKSEQLAVGSKQWEDGRWEIGSNQTSVDSY